MKKSILSVTGTRADYGIYRPVYQALQSSSFLSLGVVAVGMHLREKFGHTVEAIRQDGFPLVAELDTMTDDDTRASMAAYIGRTTESLASIFAREAPSLVLLLGDRGEQLAGAIAASYQAIPIAHLHGGEQSGHIDARVRHAVTHLADIHLTTAEPHAACVRALLRAVGREADHVHVVGAPALDTIRHFRPLPREELFQKLGFDRERPLMLLVQHPDTLDALPPERQISCTLTAAQAFDGNVLALGANADAGGIVFNERLQDLVRGRPHSHFSISLPHEEYLSWLACADVLVGNSSSGIIEAASFHLPVVNIGNRQRGRLRSGNVIDVPYDAAAIRDGIAQAMSVPFRAHIQQCQNAYGDGHAEERIVRILEEFFIAPAVSACPSASSVAFPLLRCTPPPRDCSS